MSEDSDATKMRERMIILCNELESDPNEFESNPDELESNRNKDLKYYQYINPENPCGENVIFCVKNKITALLLSIEKLSSEDMVRQYKRIDRSLYKISYLDDNKRLLSYLEDYMRDKYRSVQYRELRVEEFMYFDIPKSIDELIAKEDDLSSGDIKYWTSSNSSLSGRLYLSKTIYGAFGIISRYLDDFPEFRRLLGNIEDNIRYQIPAADKINKELIENFMIDFLGMVENEVFGYEITPTKSAYKR